MKTSHLAAFVAVLTLGLTAAPLAAQDGAEQEAVEAIDQLRDDFLATFKAAAPAEAAQLFTEEGVYMPQAAATARGREAIQQRLEQFLSGQTVSMSGISEETVVAGDRVIDRGIISITISPEGTEESGSDTGKYVVVASPAEEGWKIDWFIWSLDHPLRQVESQEEE